MSLRLTEPSQCRSVLLNPVDNPRVGRGSSCSVFAVSLNVSASFIRGRHLSSDLPLFKAPQGCPLSLTSCQQTKAKPTSSLPHYDRHIFITMSHGCQHFKNLLSVRENKEDGAGVMRGAHTHTHTHTHTIVLSLCFMAANISKIWFMLQKTRNMALVLWEVHTRTHTHTHTLTIVLSLCFMAVNISKIWFVTKNKEDGAGIMRGAHSNVHGNKTKKTVDWTKLTRIISQYWRYLNAVMESRVI